MPGPVGFDPAIIWPSGPGSADCGFLRLTARRIVVTPCRAARLALARLSSSVAAQDDGCERQAWPATIQQAATKRTSDPSTYGSKAGRTAWAIRSRVASSDVGQDAARAPSRVM